MDVAHELFPGLSLHGYFLENCLGHGALSSVYRAHSARNAGAPPVLITVLHVPGSLSAQTQEQLRARFWQYAERLALLTHPSLLPLLDYGERNGQCYLLSPEVTGQPLSQTLVPSRRWQPRELVALLCSLTKVLQSFQEQVLPCTFFHPAQVLLGETSGALTLAPNGLLLPWILRRQGTAEALARSGSAFASVHSVSNTILGNPHYLAPEVLRGTLDDPRALVYSLGILLFALLSGSLPFAASREQEVLRQHLHAPLPSLHERAPQVPHTLERVVNRALQRDPEQRFSSPQHLLEAYQEALHERFSHTEEQRAVQRLHSVATLTQTPARGARTEALSWHGSALGASQPSAPLRPTSEVQASSGVPGAQREDTSKPQVPSPSTSGKARARQQEELQLMRQHLREQTRTLRAYTDHLRPSESLHALSASSSSAEPEKEWLN